MKLYDQKVEQLTERLVTEQENTANLAKQIVELIKQRSAAIEQRDATVRQLDKAEANLTRVTKEREEFEASRNRWRKAAVGLAAVLLVLGYLKAGG